MKINYNLNFVMLRLPTSIGHFIEHNEINARSKHGKVNTTMYLVSVEWQVAIFLSEKT